MKRKDRGKALYNPDKMPNQNQPQPNNQPIDDYKRSITGNLHVRGEITAISTPEEKRARIATEHKQDASDTKKRRVEYAMLGVVIIYTIFAGWQGCSTAGQLKEARKITISTNANFQASQRAWIGAASVEIPTPQAEKAIVWRVVLKNFGNSPAMNVSIRDTAQLFVSGSIDPAAVTFLSLDLPNPSHKSMPIFNGATATNTGGITFLPTSGQVDDILHSRSLIVYVAEITYQDIFGKTHTTRLCQVWNALGAQSCGFGETAD